MRKQGVYDWPGVRVLEGRWQDFLGEDANSSVEDFLEGVPRGSFDAVFIDTFAEGWDGEFLRENVTSCSSNDRQLQT